MNYNQPILQFDKDRQILDKKNCLTAIDHARKGNPKPVSSSSSSSKDSTDGSESFEKGFFLTNTTFTLLSTL